MIHEEFEVSTFPLAVCVFIDCVFIVTPILARIAPGKGLAVGKST
jgi:hypothetical protein